MIVKGFRSVVATLAICAMLGACSGGATPAGKGKSDKPHANPWAVKPKQP